LMEENYFVQCLISSTWVNIQQESIVFCTKDS